MKHGYSLERRGSLLLTRATIGSKDSIPLAMVLMIDTGASFTVIRPGLLNSIGCTLSSPTAEKSLVTGQGVISAPLIEVPWFNCLGQLVKLFPVVAYSLPQIAKVDGLLGMDFLTYFRAVIDVAGAEIHIG